MDGINVEALLSSLAPMNFAAQSGSPPASTDADGLFLTLLQSFAGSIGGDGQAEAAQTTAPPGDWLAMLFGLLAPSGTSNKPTPDSSGEASDGTGASVSLTDMMAAMQSLAGDALTGSLTAEQMVQAFTQSAKDASAFGDIEGEPLQQLPEKMTERAELAQNPALLAMLSQLQMNAASPQQPAETTADTVAAATLIAETSQPKTVPVQLTDAATTAENQAQPQTTAQPTLTHAGKATPAAPTIAAPESTVPTAGKPAVNPAVSFEKTLNVAQNTQPTPQPATTTFPATETVAQPQPAGSEKMAALPADAPIASAPPASAPPMVSTPPAVDAPATPTLPNIPALHQLVDTISVLKQNGQTAVRLHLHPESLGQVLVQMHVHNGDVTVQLLTETGKAQSLIQHHLPELKAAFSAQGLSTGALDVSVGSDASAFSAPQRQNFNWQADSGRHTVSSVPEDGNEISPTRPMPRNRHTSGRIDYQI